MSVSSQEFLQQRAAIRGARNPQRMQMPLWEELIRTGEKAYSAARRHDCDVEGPAGWCFDRFGVTRTRLPDGRIVCVGGEHEDHYDPDFFIYNDVVVIDPRDGENDATDYAIQIYNYPSDTFPPTDFHTATLIGDAIYIVGGIGYVGARGGPATPVYRIDLPTLAVSRVITTNAGPGWIHHHRAERAEGGAAIRVAGGTVISIVGAKEQNAPNEETWQLNVAIASWERVTGAVPHVAEEVLDLPPGWEATGTAEDAAQLRADFMREAGPTDPLFAGDFWPVGPVGRDGGSCQRVALRFLDGTGRWAISEWPGGLGREEPHAPLAIYSDWQTFRDRLANDGAEP